VCELSAQLTSFTGKYMCVGDVASIGPGPAAMSATSRYAVPPEPRMAEGPTEC